MKNAKQIVAMAILMILSFSFLYASDPDAPPITANKFETAPEIDGVMDLQWEPLKWHSLNYVWMEWGETVDSTDYYGRFKVGWSEETDLLYFFVEITDDVLVEKYSELGGNTFYNDIVEIFIDENNSGGMHIFDTETTDAENAFSYHLCPLDTPDEGAPVTDFTVSDLDGTNWGDSYSPEYFPHFPEAILVKDGDQYYWEFSLTVYTDQYETNAAEGTEAELTLDKKIGLALAYCETDNLAVHKREMFLGSFPGHDDKLGDADGGNLYGYNDTWQNADDYNVLTLADVAVPDFNDPGRTISDELTIRNLGANGGVIVSFRDRYRGIVETELFDITGKQVYRAEKQKSAGQFEVALGTPGAGVYIVRLTAGNRVISKKVLVH